MSKLESSIREVLDELVELVMVSIESKQTIDVGKLTSMYSEKVLSVIENKPIRTDIDPKDIVLELHGDMYLIYYKDMHINQIFADIEKESLKFFYQENSQNDSFFNLGFEYLRNGVTSEYLLDSISSTELSNFLASGCDPFRLYEYPMKKREKYYLKDISKSFNLKKSHFMGNPSKLSDDEDEPVSVYLDKAIINAFFESELKENTSIDAFIKELVHTYKDLIKYQKAVKGEELDISVFTRYPLKFRVNDVVMNSCIWFTEKGYSLVFQSLGSCYFKGKIKIGKYFDESAVEGYLTINDKIFWKYPFDETFEGSYLSLADIKMIKIELESFMDKSAKQLVEDLIEQFSNDLYARTHDFIGEVDKFILMELPKGTSFIEESVYSETIGFKGFSLINYHEYDLDLEEYFITIRL